MIKATYETRQCFHQDNYAVVVRTETGRSYSHVGKLSYINGLIRKYRKQFALECGKPQ